MFRHLWLVCLGLVVNSAGSPAFGFQEAQFEEPERQALSYRAENVKQGYVRFRVIDKVGPQPRETLYETTFDAQRISQKRRIRLIGQEKWGEASLFLLTPTETVTSFNSETVATRSKSTLSVSAAREMYRVLDPRPLGLDLNGANRLHVARLDSVVTVPSARTPAKLAKENRGGLDTWRLDYQTKFNGSDVSVWIAPSRGHAVVAAEHSNKKDQSATLVESKFKQYGDVWYPERVLYTLKFNGYVKRQHVVEVEEARFSKLPDSALRFESLGFEPGREIGDSLNGPPTMRVWDGKKLLAADGVPLIVPGPAVSSGLPRWALIVAGVVLALLAAGIAWRVVRSRRARQDEGA